MSKIHLSYFIKKIKYITCKNLLYFLFFIVVFSSCSSRNNSSPPPKEGFTRHHIPGAKPLLKTNPKTTEINRIGLPYETPTINRMNPLETTFKTSENNLIDPPPETPEINRISSSEIISQIPENNPVDPETISQTSKKNLKNHLKITSSCLSLFKVD